MQRTVQITQPKRLFKLGLGALHHPELDIQKAIRGWPGQGSLLLCPIPTPQTGYTPLLGENQPATERGASTRAKGSRSAPPGASQYVCTRGTEVPMLEVEPERPFPANRENNPGQG